MPLALYRRHKTTCKLSHLGVAGTNCPCPIWTYGTVHGRMLRRSMSTKDWTHAHSKMLKLESGPSSDEKPPEVTIMESVQAYLRECEVRQIAVSTQASYRNALNKFAEWCATQKVFNVSALTLKVFSDYRMSLQIAARTQVTELTVLRQWNNFCVDHKWAQENHAKKVKLPKAKDLNVTMPYSREDVTAMLDNCHTDSEPAKMRALLMTLLYSGLRISDAIQLDRLKVQSDGRLLLRMEKTGHPVYVRLPQGCMDALNALPVTGEHFFWDKSKHTLASEINMARTAIHDLGLRVGINDARPHRFRDTFAVSLLIAGVDIRTVQKLLGHSSLTTTEKHYSPWVTAMQNQLDEATAKLAF